MTPAQSVSCFLRLPEVMHRTGLSRPTIYRRMEQKTFPMRIPLGGGVVAWDEREITAWQTDRLAAREMPNGGIKQGYRNTL
ncbi:AlpA family phage regulatory protein [Granulicella sp. 5B5]|nr:AlpA family phage regulatory protein [Granulicella sp. 5B5]